MDQIKIKKIIKAADYKNYLSLKLKKLNVIKCF